MTVLHILWIIFLYILMIDILIIVVGGTLWVFNIWYYEMFKVDLAKKLLERMNDRRGN